MNTQPFRRMQSNLIPEAFPCFRFGLKKKMTQWNGWLKFTKLENSSRPVFKNS